MASDSPERESDFVIYLVTSCIWVGYLKDRIQNTSFTMKSCVLMTWQVTTQVQSPPTYTPHPSSFSTGVLLITRSNSLLFRKPFQLTLDPRNSHTGIEKIQLPKQRPYTLNESHIAHRRHWVGARNLHRIIQASTARFVWNNYILHTVAFDTT